MKGMRPDDDVQEKIEGQDKIVNTEETKGNWGGRRKGAGRRVGSVKGRTVVTVSATCKPETKVWLITTAMRMGLGYSKLAGGILDSAMETDAKMAGETLQKPKKRKTRKKG